MKKMYKYWFVLAFFGIMLLPFTCLILGLNTSLNGETDSVEEIQASVETISDGSYQTYLNTWWENNFPGRQSLMKMRNQFIYSVINDSPNSNVVIGKDDQLFERYVALDPKVKAPASKDYYDALGKKLQTLRNELSKAGKELYVFVTPSKATFCKEYIPYLYKLVDQEKNYTYTNYSLLVQTLKENSILYFDSVDYIRNNMDSKKYRSPVFYKTGIHWSHAWGESSAVGFVRYINLHSRYYLGDLSVIETSAATPDQSDIDLYSLLNLLIPPHDHWYSTKIIVNKESDKPSVFIRGGSFTFQSLNSLVNSNVFDKDVHLSNNRCFYDKYNDSDTLSSYQSYDEVDIDSLVGQSDIIILEVNEGAIANMSFGFIDYLLQHPEYMDNNY